MREARILPTDNYQTLNGHTAATAPSHRNLRMNETAPETCDPPVAELIQQMLIYIGEDPEREGLQRTPQRVAQSLDFLTSGYHTSIADVLNEALFETDSEEMVIVKDIEFYSLCEHHLLPFFGKIHVGYIPNGQIIGLSKIARVIDIFARRLQVQEHLTNQIADALMDILEAKGVAVVSEASHLCMMMRGVQRQNSTTIASAMRGLFKFDRPTRNEFLQAVRA